MTLPTEPELKARVLLPKFTAAASFIGSALIIRDIVKRYRTDRRKISPRSRLLAALSLCDCLASAAWFLTSWPIPKDDPFWSMLSIWNVGTTQTCSAQGFFVHMSMGSLMYNCCLALHYLLVIRYNWSNERVAKTLEPFMHIFSISFALATGIFLLVKDAFNPVGWDCYISAYPPFCDESYQNDGASTCIRGDNASLYREIFWHYPVWITIFWLSTTMLAVFLKIRSLEQRTSRFHASNNRQRMFAWQAFLYVGSVILTWGLASSMHVFLLATDEFPSFWLLLFATTMVPSQGIMNSLIYFSNADQGKTKRSLSSSATGSGTEDKSDTTGQGISSRLSAWFNASKLNENSTKNVEASGDLLEVAEEASAPSLTNQRLSASEDSGEESSGLVDGEDHKGDEEIETV